MRQGEFKHRVTVQAATESRGASGSTVLSWAAPSTVGERWAHIEVGQARTVIAAQAINPETDAVITMPGHLAVTTKHRIYHVDGRAWDIVGVVPLDGKTAANSNQIQLHCKGGLRQGS